MPITFHCLTNCPFFGGALHSVVMIKLKIEEKILVFEELSHERNHIFDRR